MKFLWPVAMRFRWVILLTLLTRPDERAIAFDLFEQQELNRDESGRGDLDRLQAAPPDLQLPQPFDRDSPLLEEIEAVGITPQVCTYGGLGHMDIVENSVAFAAQWALALALGHLAGARHLAGGSEDPLAPGRPIPLG